MYYQAELVLRNYVPDSIEPGMFFITRDSSGSSLFPLHLWEFTSSMLLNDPLEEIFDKLGYPVKLFIIDPIDHSILASQEQIGWFDEGEDSDEYRDTALKDINHILENKGLIEIEISDEDVYGTVPPISYGAIIPILEENKVIIRTL